MRLRALKWLEITENSSRFIWAKSAGWCNIHFKKCVFIKIKNKLPNKLWKGLQIQSYKPKMKSIKRNQPSSKLRKHQLEILTNREAHYGVQFLNQTREIWALFSTSALLYCALPGTEIDGIQKAPQEETTNKRVLSALYLSRWKQILFSDSFSFCPLRSFALLSMTRDFNSQTSTNLSNTQFLPGFRVQLLPMEVNSGLSS